ncbi:site-2 protease family protein [Jannaschia aquimarina]|uniref:Peptidase family M50 n=1 Tax=Jannaschia aquimarina TaxID=935700 RepID=A0A0D1CLA8_9RHOB|nr:site-2 protease family protein [Jannaschia aquimarina]KIT15597.1 Peptidase family M50 [Jannaschia aquimarina]SNT27484.1 Zn-dependent protease (includes SpoIVFB) [Jannaschia aquimarina]
MIDRHETPIARLPGPWGVPIDIGPSFLMLAGLLILTMQDKGWALVFVGLIALSILLHEIGHAWGCLVQGVKVHRIMLWGGGGFCQHQITRDALKDELIVAMGPLTNLALWAIASLFAPQVMMTNPEVGAWMSIFASINLTLFALNLIPVQPLDGGRLFHLAMLRILAPRVAMQVAGWVGLICAILWIPAMFLAWTQFGFLLLFLPSISAHWEMAKGRAVA